MNAAAAPHGPPPRPARTQAVLMVDLVDSVSLMRVDEGSVMARWADFVSEVKHRIVPLRGGRIVRSLGDGLLMVFDQAPAAVACARELHQVLARGNVDQPPSRHLVLRAGLHIGEVVEGELDVYGTAVNLAARVMALAWPGETWTTDDMRHLLVEGIDGDFEDLGDFFVKGFDEALRLYRVGARSTADAMPGVGERLAHALRPGVAVLPLEPGPGQTGDGVLGEALADEITGHLARLPELHVISSLSTRALKGRRLDLAELADHLKVAYVLSGSCRFEGDRLRLRLDLAATSGGQLLWSQVCETTLREAFDLQGSPLAELSHQAAGAVLAREVERTGTQSPVALESYALLFGALTHMHRPTRRDFERARPLLDELAHRHRRDGLAQAWLAKWHVLRAAQGWSPDLAAEAAQARTQVMLSLQADPGNALALAIGGHVHGYFSKDSEAAGRMYQDALSANPNEPLAWLYSCTWHAYRGESVQAEAAAAKALRLSPLDPMKYYFQSFAATALLSGGQAEASEALARQSLRSQRGHASTWRTLTYALVQQGKVEEAREAVSRLRELEPTYTVSAFRQRFPGRDGPMAEPFARALEAAGLPP